LAELAHLGPLPEEDYWEYCRNETVWTGELNPRPSFSAVARMSWFDPLAAQIEGSLKADYPQHMLCVGTHIGGRGPLQASLILSTLIFETYRRFGSINPTDEQIEQLLADVSLFFDKKVVCVRLYAPALNLHGPSSMRPISFPGGFVLRPILESEATQFFGGNPTFSVRKIPWMGIPDFLFVKEIEIPKIIGDFTGTLDDSILRQAREELDRFLLAFATFKDAGAVCYEAIHIVPAEFTLGLGYGPMHLYFNEHVPFGIYGLKPEEASQLENHVRHFEGMHATLEMASQRLVDAGRRTKPRDALVDAVIGLESILLASSGKDRGELSFRFSLHYAALFAVNERMEAFYTARNLYDLRSRIAHGSNFGDKVKINGKPLDIGQAATLARSVLRKTISKFVINSKTPDFMKTDYWLAKELGLPNPDEPPTN